MLNINPEFKKLIPPLTADEFRQLEANCLAEGIRDAIVTWNGFVIDGHNRYEIAQLHGLKFNTESKEFENELDVKIWMICNQFGRRNLNAWQRSVLALELEDVFKSKAKDQQIRKPNFVLQNSAKQKPIDTRKELASIANVSHDTISKVKVIADKGTPDIKAQLAAGEVSISHAYNEIKREDKRGLLEQKKQDYFSRVIAPTTAINKVDIFNTNIKYRVVYADPAWQYDDKQNIPNLGGAEKHYSTMSTKDICNLPINDITDKDAVLFLWVTSPLLPDGLRVIDAWGFKYKTSFVWDKVSHNMGHYNSVRHEFLLVATKGSCTPDNKKLYDSVQSIEKTMAHSQKPIEFLNIIDDLYTFGNKIELFCRFNNSENWAIWGNEI